MAVKYQESAGILVFYTDNNEIKFLLLKYPSYWGFAKGIIEPDETIEQAAKRELEEEASIKKIQIIPGFRHVQEWFFRAEGQLIKKKATYLLARISKEEAEKVKISHEHEDFQWLTHENALKIMKIKNNKDMLTNAYEFTKEFSTSS